MTAPQVGPARPDADSPDFGPCFASKTDPSRHLDRPRSTINCPAQIGQRETFSRRLRRATSRVTGGRGCSAWVRGCFDPGSGPVVRRASRCMQTFGVPGVLWLPPIAFELGVEADSPVGFGARYAAILLAGSCLFAGTALHRDFSDQIQRIMFLKTWKPARRASPRSPDKSGFAVCLGHRDRRRE